MEHHVIINSIGTASPSASKVLSEALKVPQDYILKLLYNAPSVLFQKVDIDTALKAENTLKQLGLEVSVCDENDTIDLFTELVDISLSFDFILKLPTVVEQLSSFLGCKQSETLNLLLNEPSIVLGNVSVATAKALQKRVDATVNFSNPRKDKYTVVLDKEFAKTELTNIERQLSNTAILHKKMYLIENISYENSQLLWRKYQSKKGIRIVNQSHQLVHVVMQDFNIDDEKQQAFLINSVGIPKNILEDIQQVLPITLFENKNCMAAEKIVKECEAIGITVVLEKDFSQNKRIEIDEIQDLEKVNRVLGQFILEKDLPKKGQSKWISNDTIPFLIARYLYAQLESLNCNPEIID